MGVKSVEIVEICSKSDGKMSNVFHSKTGSKIQLFARLAVCFQDPHKAVAQAIAPLEMEIPLPYCGREGSAEG